MLTPEKKEIYDWFQGLKAQGLTKKHIREIATEKRKEINNPILLRYFDLLVFSTSSNYYAVRNLPYFKKKNKVARRKQNNFRHYKGLGIYSDGFVKIISTPMGGQNKKY